MRSEFISSAMTLSGYLQIEKAFGTYIFCSFTQRLLLLCVLDLHVEEHVSPQCKFVWYVANLFAPFLNILTNVFLYSLEWCLNLYTCLTSKGKVAEGLQL